MFIRRIHIRPIISVPVDTVVSGNDEIITGRYSIKYEVNICKYDITLWTESSWHTIRFTGFLAV